MFKGTLISLKERFSGNPIPTVVFLLCFSSLFSQQVLAASTPAEAFKALLSRPQHIREISYILEDRELTNGPQYFSGAFEADNFFLRMYLPGENLQAVMTPTNTMALSDFCGVTEGKFWQISGLQILMSETPADAVYANSENTLYMLENAMTFGSLGMKVGSFVWTGDQCTAVKNVLITGDTRDSLTAKLTVSNGYPAKLDWYRGKAPVRTTYYDYPADPSELPLGVPQTISLCGAKEPKSSFSLRLRLLKFRNEEKKIEASYFDPKRFIKPEYMSLIVSSNNHLKILQDHEANVAKSLLTPRLKSNRPKRFIVIGFMLVGGLFLVVAFVRSHEDSKKRVDSR